jgi:hypothetical protein
MDEKYQGLFAQCLFIKFYLFFVIVHSFVSARVPAVRLQIVACAGDAGNEKSNKAIKKNVAELSCFLRKQFNVSHYLFELDRFVVQPCTRLHSLPGN